MSDTKKQLMQGNNTLSLCPATMIAVVQAWLDEEITSPVQVSEVRFEREGSVGTFVVRFERKGEAE
jgi:hypothetical protein